MARAGIIRVILARGRPMGISQEDGRLAPIRRVGIYLAGIRAGAAEAIRAAAVGIPVVVGMVVADTAAAVDMAVADIIRR